MPLTSEQLTALDAFEVLFLDTVDAAARSLDQERRFLLSLRSSRGEAAPTRRLNSQLTSHARAALRGLIGGES